MPHLIGPDLIGIQVADFDASRTFTTAVVGLTAAPNGPPEAVVFDTKPNHFALRAPAVELDAVALHHHLASRDALIAFPPKGGPFRRYFAFQDPFGCTIPVHTVQEAA